MENREKSSRRGGVSSEPSSGRSIPSLGASRRTRLVASVVALTLTITILGVGATVPTRAGASNSSVTSAYRDQVLADGPVAYWRLGETSGAVASDEVGANPGTFNGVTLGQPGPLVGDLNTAVSFDGANDFVTVPHSGALNATSGVTVEGWIKRSKSGAWQVVVGKPGTGQSRGENYALWFNTSNQLLAYFGDGTNYVNVRAPLDTNWHYVAATYNNATAKLYVDGTLHAQTSSSIHLTSNTLPLNMGRANGNSSFFGGLLDEVAVYNTALSAERIQAHYETGRAIDSTPPVGQPRCSRARQRGGELDARPSAAPRAPWPGTRQRSRCVCTPATMLWGRRCRR